MVVEIYNIDADMNALQRTIINDATILSLLGLTGKTNAEIARKIIKRSQWSDLATSDKRLCVYPLPSRPTRNEILYEELFEVDCHVPAIEDYKARQIVGRVVDILNNKSINGRYLKAKGVLGELPTVSGFYCIGVRFGFYSPI